MATNPYNNKVQLADGTVLIDLTSDTVTAADILSGVTAHDATGASITGSLSAMTLAEIYAAVQAGWGKTAYLEMVPYVYDYKKGYIDSGTWKYQDPTNTYVDVYRVKANNTYFLALGETVGTRFRAMFTTTDITTVTTDVVGTSIINKNNPSSHDTFTYKATNDGYVAVSKDNVGTANLLTHMVNVSDWL